MSSEQIKKAEMLLHLHHADEILVLLNAWDVASARVFQAAGSKAIGTTSMGIAASAGYPDVQQIPLEMMLASITRITEAVDIPVTADMEAGYGETPQEVADVVKRAIECGAVGINIEDGTGDPTNPLINSELHAEKIRAIRQMANEAGIHLVVNARTDVFLDPAVTADDNLADAVARGNRYRQAGADCVFVPGGMGRDTIGALVTQIDAPINVVANPAISVPVVPTIPELQELGVARVSVGSGPLRAGLAAINAIAHEALNDGSYERMKNLLSAPNAEAAYQAAIGK